MKRATLAWIFATLAGSAWCADDGVVTHKPAYASDRLFFPRNSVRGFLDFQVAPPHNEVDLGLCTLDKSNPFYPLANCSAYARYIFSGYLEAQPVGSGPLRRAFLFFEPKFYGGTNVPQERYTASAAPILWEVSMGAGFQLPKDLELRVTAHEVNLLGRYAAPGGAATLRTDGPYGRYSTVGVRWYFGGWAHSGQPGR